MILFELISLCLVIRFQFVLRHPGLHVRDAHLHGQDIGVYLIMGTGLKQLCVISYD